MSGVQRELFDQIEGVQPVTIVTDRDTGQSRGFGFVEVATAVFARSALPRTGVDRYDVQEHPGTDPSWPAFCAPTRRARSAGSGGWSRICALNSVKSSDS